MKPVMLAPRSALDEKPPHGAPCTRCGLCCMATICPLGAAIFGREHGPCPALLKPAKAGEGHGCGLVAEPMRWRVREALLHGVERMRAAALHLIGSGTGCDARFNGEAINSEFHKALAEHDRRTRVETREAKRLWLGRRAK